MVREPVSEEVEREEPVREVMRESTLVSEEELDVEPRMEKVRKRELVREDWAGNVPRRDVMRWRMAEVVERGDTEPMRVKAEERVLITVELADEAPESETSPTRDKSPDVMEVDGIALAKESMV